MNNKQCNVEDYITACQYINIDSTMISLNVKILLQNIWLLQNFQLTCNNMPSHHAVVVEMSNVDFSQIEPCLTEGTMLALKAFGFSRMTPVQAATIPLFLTNKVRYEYYDNNRSFFLLKSMRL